MAGEPSVSVISGSVPTNAAQIEISFPDVDPDWWTVQEVHVPAGYVPCFSKGKQKLASLSWRFPEDGNEAKMVIINEFEMEVGAG